MKLFFKILGIGVVGLLVALSIAVVAVYCGGRVLRVQQNMTDLLEFRSALASAQSAHIQWLRTIEMAIIDDKAELKIGTDGTLCEFGKWYYAEDTKDFMARMPEDVQKCYQDLETDHLTIHRLGGELINKWDKNNLTPSEDFLKEKIIPAATALLGKIGTTRGVINERMIVAQEKMENTVRTQNWIIGGLGESAPSD